MNILEVGHFVELKDVGILRDPIKLDVWEENNWFSDINYNEFDISIMKGNKIIEITNENAGYLNKFHTLFLKPKKEDLFNFLIKNDRFEEAIEIENGKIYSNLLDLDDLHKRYMDELKKIILGLGNI